MVAPIRDQHPPRRAGWLTRRTHACEGRPRCRHSPEASGSNSTDTLDISEPCLVRPLLSAPAASVGAMRRVETDEAASALADRLNGADRDRPIVVVTTPSGQQEPWIDVREIERQVGDLAEVYLMPTGPFTWSFSNKMPAMTQVFGGAGRVYPVGHAWASNPTASPLRFAYSADQGPRTTDHLIDDAMSMAALAGLTTDQRKIKRSRLEGVVAGIVADRALVKLSNRRLGNVSPALAVPAVAIERVLAEGQPVLGWLDDDNSWFDVREMVLAPQDALSAYALGEVVLTEVGEVEETSAELFLHPLVPVQIGRDEVTGNDLDDLRTLLTRGEVVAARVTALGPDWRLSLLDVDDDDEPVPAASLLRGGPPWLLPPSDEEISFEPLAPAPEVPFPEPPAPASPPDRGEPATLASPRPVPPSPRLLDPRQRHLEQSPAPAASAPEPAHSGELERALRERDDLRSELDGFRQEVRMLRQERANFDSRNGHLERQLADQRARLRKAKRPATTDGVRPVFADAEQGFRYAVLTAWATRTPLAEQAAVPLPEFRIGQPFIASLQGLEGVTEEKVADVVFEIVTGRAKELSSRELHQYRESEGGGAATVHRSSDGATLWRANLQTKTASARRIHFWQLPGGQIELWHVGTHDARPPL